MSQAQKERIDLIMNWGGRIVFGVSAFLLVSFANDLKTDVRTMMTEQQVMKVEQQVIKEKVRRIERVVDRLEDGK